MEGRQIIVEADTKELGYTKPWQQVLIKTLHTLMHLTGGLIIWPLKALASWYDEDDEFWEHVLISAVVVGTVALVGSAVWFVATHECTASHVEHRVREAHYERRCLFRDDDFNCTSWTNDYVPRKEWDETVCDKWERRDRHQQ